MSLRPSAPEFKPLSESSEQTTSCVLSMPDLGYEFPYTMVAMPIQITPSKRLWSEMAQSVKSYLKRCH